MKKETTKKELSFHEKLDLCHDELYGYYKKSFIHSLIDVFGGTGLSYLCLDNLLHHGKLCMPNCYKYRKELLTNVRNELKFFKEHIEKSARLYREYKKNLFKKEGLNENKTIF